MRFYCSACGGLLLLAIIEAVVTTVIINRALLGVTEGDKRVKKGNGRYILMRLASPRRMRRPRPSGPRGRVPILVNTLAIFVPICSREPKWFHALPALRNGRAGKSALSCLLIRPAKLGP